MNRSLRHPKSRGPLLDLLFGKKGWKRRGEWVELMFMSRAHAHGLVVSKPWGDSARYDFVVEVPTSPESCSATQESCSGTPSRAASVSSKKRARDGVRFLRVQVKSTMQTAKHKNGPPGAYLCNTISRGPGKRLQTYSARDVDFFALFVIPLDLWYIIPLADLPKSTYALLLDTTRPGNKYFKYLEAWHLLRGRP